MTQCDAILQHLREHGSITPREALDEYGCFRLAARINELRKAGHDIETMWTRFGKQRWARYRLMPATCGACQRELW